MERQSQSLNEAYLVVCLYSGPAVDALSRELTLQDFISLSEVTWNLHRVIYEVPHIAWRIQLGLLIQVRSDWAMKKDVKQLLPPKIQKRLKRSKVESARSWLKDRWSREGQNLAGIPTWEKCVMSYYARMGIARENRLPRILQIYEADGRLRFLSERIHSKYRKVKSLIQRNPLARFGGYMKTWHANGAEIPHTRDAKDHIARSEIARKALAQVAPRIREPYGLPNLFMLLKSTFEFQYQMARDIDIKDISEISLKICPPKDSHAALRLPDGIVVAVPNVKLTYRGMAKVYDPFAGKMIIRGYCPEEESIEEEYTRGFYGYADEDGTVHPTVSLVRREWVGFFLRALDGDLWNVCGMLGKVLNTCIFCQKPLSTAESLKRGYGFDCMKKWNLERDDIILSNSIRTGHSSTFANAPDAREFASAMDEDDIPLMTLMGLRLSPEAMRLEELNRRILEVRITSQKQEEGKRGERSDDSDPSASRKKKKRRIKQADLDM